MLRAPNASGDRWSGPEPHRLDHHPSRGTWQPGDCDHRLEAPRRKFLEAVAVGQDEPADAIGTSVTRSGRRHRRSRCRRCVTSSRSSAPRNSLDHPGDPVGRQVRIRAHRLRVATERPVGNDAADGGGEGARPLVPEPPVDEEAVDEDDRRSVAAVSR